MILTEWYGCSRLSGNASFWGYGQLSDYNAWELRTSPDVVISVIFPKLH